ncbi:MAG: TetR/AcrR family transcriptional regulator [Myxococcota bacterium]
MTAASTPRGPALREALLRETLAILEEGGIGALNLRLLASRIGVTQPALYRHFPSRDALLEAVRARGLLALDAACLAAVGDDEPYGRLVRIGGAYVRFSAENPGWFRLGFGTRHDTAPPPAPPSSASPTCQLLALGSLARIVPLEDPAFGPSFRAWWGLCHGLGGLVVERVFRLVDTDTARLDAANDAIASYGDTLRARWGPPRPDEGYAPGVLLAALRRGLPTG